MQSEPEAPAATGLIPLCASEIAGNDIAYVTECLESGWVSTAGPFVERFERELAAYVGTKFAIATNSGTAALHASLLTAGVKQDDEVLVSDMTFIAPVNAIRYIGAWPVLVDAEPEYWQIDVERLASFLANECSSKGGQLRNRASGRTVRAIMPVHLLGHPCDLDPIRELAARYGLLLIEDSTESLGARYKSEKVGAAGLSSLSFNGNKLMTTGGGGAIVTNDADWAARAKYLVTQAKDDPLEYIHNSVGFNYRMPSLNAALGCSQLERIESNVEAKRRMVRRYTAGLGAVPGITLMPSAPWASPAWWLYTIRIDHRRYGRSSRELMRLLGKERINCRPIFQPMHLSKAHAGCQAVGGEVAERIVAEALSLPSSVGLTEEDQDRVIATIKEFGP
jgi:perosamine synthetase